MCFCANICLMFSFTLYTYLCLKLVASYQTLDKQVIEMYICVSLTLLRNLTKFLRFTTCVFISTLCSLIGCDHWHHRAKDE